MELNYDEKVMLALYAEIYNRSYDYTNDKTFDGYKVTHLEMQKACLILGLIVNNYFKDYNWTKYGPISMECEQKISFLEAKEMEIDKFYQAFQENRNDVLNKLFVPDIARNLNNASIIFNALSFDTDNDFECIELMAAYVYLANKDEEMTFYTADKMYSEQHEENLSFLMRQRIWKELSAFGLVKELPRRLIITKKGFKRSE